MARRLKNEQRADQQAPSFGNRLREARTAHSLTLTQLGKASGVSASYLSRLETGAVQQPSASVIQGIASALGVSATDLGLVTLPSAAATCSHGDTVEHVLAEFSKLRDEVRQLKATN